MPVEFKPFAWYKGPPLSIPFLQSKRFTARLCLPVGGDSTHVVVHRWQHRRRLLLGSLCNAGCHNNEARYTWLIHTDGNFRCALSWLKMKPLTDIKILLENLGTFRCPRCIPIIFIYIYTYWFTTCGWWSLVVLSIQHHQWYLILKIVADNWCDHKFGIELLSFV